MNPHWKDRLAITLFFGLFAATGLGVLCLGLAPTLHDAWRMQQWEPVQATITSAELESHHGDDSTTYKATATYTYRYNDQLYHGHRVNHGETRDNVGSYQQDMASTLAYHWQHRLPYTAWANPENPSESILDRKIRWDMLGFYLLFVVLFGGVGIGGILYVWLARSKIVHDAPATQPWLANSDWADKAIIPDDRNGRWVMLFFAAFWNLISAPVIFAVPQEWAKGNHAILIALLFPLVGLLLIGLAIRQFLGWQRFGTAALQMNPFPGSIGGDVGGHVDIRLPFNPATQVKAQLSAVLSVVSGTGKHRERRESLLWESSGIAHTEDHGGHTRIWLKFAVPKDLPPSEPESDRYHLWRLTLSADVDGVDFSRHYTLPVYATAQTASGIRENTASTAATLDANYSAIEALVNPVQVNGGTEWLQPALRSPGNATALLLFGGVFTGAGVFLAMEGIWYMFPIFLLFGIVIMLAGFYTLGNSLFVRIEGDSIVRIRRIFGITANRQRLQQPEIEGLFIHSGQSSGQVAYYDVYLKTADNEYAIAEGFKGREQALLAQESLCAITGLKPLQNRITPRIQLGRRRHR